MQPTGPDPGGSAWAIAGSEGPILLLGENGVKGRKFREPESEVEVETRVEVNGRRALPGGEPRVVVSKSNEVAVRALVVGETSETSFRLVYLMDEWQRLRPGGRLCPEFRCE